MAPMDRLEVFDAKIVGAGQRTSSARQSWFLSSRFSVTASMTRSHVRELVEVGGEREALERAVTRRGVELGLLDQLVERLLDRRLALGEQRRSRRRAPRSGNRPSPRPGRSRCPSGRSPARRRGRCLAWQFSVASAHIGPSSRPVPASRSARSPSRYRAISGSRPPAGRRARRVVREAPLGLRHRAAPRWSSARSRPELEPRRGRAGTAVRRRSPTPSATGTGMSATGDERAEHHHEPRAQHARRRPARHHRPRIPPAPSAPVRVSAT